jgi:hypothetical protein
LALHLPFFGAGPFLGPSSRWSLGRLASSAALAFLLACQRLQLSLGLAFCGPATALSVRPGRLGLHKAGSQTWIGIAGGHSSGHAIGSQPVPQSAGSRGRPSARRPPRRETPPSTLGLGAFSFDARWSSACSSPLFFYAVAFPLAVGLTRVAKPASATRILPSSSTMHAKPAPGSFHQGAPSRVATFAWRSAARAERNTVVAT